MVQKGTTIMMTAVFAAVLAGAGAMGQVRQGSWTPVVESLDRGYSSISYWTYRDDGVEIGGGRISVEHGKPQWPEVLDDPASFEGATVGKLWRLGSNKWSTLDTNLPLRFGERKVAPGIYYLVVHRPTPDVWRLGLVSPKDVAAKLIDAWASQARPGEVPVLFSLPLRYTRHETRGELDVSFGLEDDDMSKGSLVIEWGPHRLDADFAIDIVSPTFYRTEDGTR